MTVTSVNLYANIGSQIATLRKRRKFSQADLAKLLPKKRTQAWISTVESGQRNISALDMFEIAAALGHSIEDLYASAPVQHTASSRLLSNIVNELTSHLPNQSPIYLQRDAGNRDSKPFDYFYTSAGSTGSLFDQSGRLSSYDIPGAVIIERYYTAPRLDPTDVVMYNKALVPRSNPHDRTTDRIMVKLKEPYDGLVVHPALLTTSDEATTTIAGKKPVVFPIGSFEILGVLTIRETLYLPSTRRAIFQQEYGIRKDERLHVQSDSDNY
jgi:transcriptional regulator with XRE-family HTH domain